MSTKRIKFSDEDIAEIIHLYEVYNFSCRLISTMYGVAKNTIRDRLLKEGVVLSAAKSMKVAVKNNLTKRKPKGKVSDQGRKNMSIAFRKMHRRRMGLEDVCLIDHLTMKQQSRYVRQSLKMVVDNKNSCKAEVVGYSHDAVVKHIADQFLEGMCWEVRKSFHIDHIVPVKAFLERGITDARIINALVNLKPMYPSQNLRKSSVYNMANFDNDLSKILASLNN